MMEVKFLTRLANVKAQHIVFKAEFLILLLTQTIHHDNSAHHIQQQLVNFTNTAHSCLTADIQERIFALLPLILIIYSALECVQHMDNTDMKGTYTMYSRGI